MLASVVRSAVLAIVAAAAVLAPQPSPSEVRALWVVRTSLTSPTAIHTMVAAAKAAGFNTLVVQIRARGDAYYRDAIEPRPSTLASLPAFDPLAEVVERAHEAGLQVHAWINISLVAGLDLPAARDHVIYRHPEWLMVPRALAEDLVGVNPRSPEYLGRLSRYVRNHSSALEGLYLSPIAGEASDYTVRIVKDIAERYPVDGVHLDYIRYPDDEFDYSREALAAFKSSLPKDASASSLLSYPQRFPQQWRAFRSDRLTALVADLRVAIRSVRPEAVVSAAVAPDPADAHTRRLQDWAQWLERDLVDVVCPMAYTTDGSVFSAQIAAARQVAGKHPVWAGIGAYRLSADQITDNIHTARRLGAGGVILFSYDSLVSSTRGTDYLAQIGRTAFNNQ